MALQAKNPFTWVEIYVDDMSRAQKFLETLLQIKLSELPMPDSVGEMQMLSFPWAEKERNISGAFVKMENMGLVAGGTLVYFVCEDCSVEEGRAEPAGGKVLQPKMSMVSMDFAQF